MTPAARLQAAIEVLDQVDSSERPADRLLRDYLRGRRYIGSKDRRAVRDFVFQCLRHRGALDWVVERAGAPSTPRTRMIACQCIGDPDTAVETLFNGQGYGPAPLSADETTLAERLVEARLDDPAMPAWARDNCPEWLHARLTRDLGASAAEELPALNRPGAVDLRVNEGRAAREPTVNALRSLGVSCEATPYAPLGIRLEGHRNVTGLPLYRDGVIEIQDEGAQLAALLVDPAPDGKPLDRVVDLCAGAGGKTLALAARMAGGGHLIACDSDAGRLGRMLPRMERAGVDGVEMVAIAERGDAWIDAQAGTADRVLIDAPCSGTGAWRRHPEAPWRLTGERISAHEARQDLLLAEAASLVKPGGRIAYVTCSLLKSENEERVAHLLTAHAGFQVVPVEAVWRAVIGDTLPEGAGSGAGPFLHLTPARNGCDGFFVAIIERAV